MPKDWRSTLPIVLSLVVLSPLAIDVYLPSFPEMMGVFKVNDKAMQLTVSLFMVCVGAGQLVGGPLSDRFGRRATALWGTAIYIVGSLIGASSETISTLYLSRAMQGIGAASCTVTAFAWVRDHFNAIESGKWITYMGGIIGVVPTLAPLLGGVLASQWGWSANFLFMALFGALIFAGVWLFIPPGVSGCIHAKGSLQQASLKNSVAEILENRQFILYSMAGMLTMGAILSYTTHAPIVAMTMGGLDEFQFALVFGGLGILKLSISLLAPEIVRVIGRRLTILIGLGISISGGAGLWFVPGSDPLLFFVPAAIGYIGFTLVFGTASGLTLEPFKHCSGVAAAIDGCARMAGGGLISALLKVLDLQVFHTVSLSYCLLVIPFLFVLRDILSRSETSAGTEIDQAA
ncbi:multidrug effflux MFS transporter [Sansalvadorimonas sp. 2012CJ34-2]|uniref:Multidrug effflux MFS transporter n=1 Tax=Parendozoicomonas callyspongiae TaxID=2942213 RepID=A0ABT0PCQ9_9GAMM|nr:multidrug effflux MFS transporter [Sansalvadorimonas sp. 2012CJ34-2]MCL6269177.1 multidrug effflux MFS transporter [Sansalvadorimonas sp. 2012CJ34-2]